MAKICIEKEVWSSLLSKSHEHLPTCTCKMSVTTKIITIKLKEVGKRWPERYYITPTQASVLVRDSKQSKL